MKPLNQIAKQKKQNKTKKNNKNNKKQKNKQQKQNKKKALSSEFSNSIFIKFHFKVY